MITGVTHPTVTVQLTGEDGNAFYIIGAIARAISQEVGTAEANEWVAAAYECSSYMGLLALAQRTVHVT